MTLPRLMISSVLQLFPSIFTYMVYFDFFLLKPIVRFIYSCLFCFLWLGLGMGGRGLLSYIWALWLCVAMGNIDGEMDSVGNACVQTLPDTNSVSVLLNYGIIFPSVPYYQGVEEVGVGRGGVLILPSCIPYYFSSLSLSFAPPSPMGLGAG